MYVSYTFLKYVYIVEWLIWLFNIGITSHLLFCGKNV
jgi:hypothetical protein